MIKFQTFIYELATNPHVARNNYFYGDFIIIIFVYNLN